MTTTTQMSLLRYEIDGKGIATLWLQSEERPVVVLDRNLIQRLNSTLDAIEQEANITAIFLRRQGNRYYSETLLSLPAPRDHQWLQASANLHRLRSFSSHREESYRTSSLEAA